MQLQRLQISAAETVHGMLVRAERLLDGIYPSIIISQVLFPLRIDGIQFPLDSIARKQRLPEKLPESVQSPGKHVPIDFEIIVCVDAGCVRIRVSSIPCQIFRVLIFLWVLPGAHEQQMFKKVSQTRQFVRILKTANVDIESCTCLVCRTIMHQQTLHTINQPD